MPCIYFHILHLGQPSVPSVEIRVQPSVLSVQIRVQPSVPSAVIRVQPSVTIRVQPSVTFLEIKDNLQFLQ